MRHLFVLLLSTAFGPDVDGLRAPDFATREAAEARLDRWGWLVWPVLDRRWPDPEQDRRARRVVRRALWGEPDSWACLSERLPGTLNTREWHAIALDEEGMVRARISRECPGESGYYLAWVHHHEGALLSGLAWRYLSRARVQHAWPTWFTVAEEQQATALMASDLELLGVPRLLVRWWLAP